MADFLIPDWPVPAHVRALQTLRTGGCSPAPWASFNLGDHVGDDPARVATNRAELRRQLPAEPLWLRQVHGTAGVDAGHVLQAATADASFSVEQGKVCAVMTADCLPVLFCDRAGTVVAAAHAGWRGLLDGILECTIAALPVVPGELLAWLDEFAERAIAVELRHPAFFARGEEERLLNRQLQARGVERICLDSRALFACTSRDPAVLHAQAKKPRLPLRPTAFSASPQLRFIGGPDLEANQVFLEPWLDKVADWIGQGLTPYVFLHTPDNHLAAAQALQAPPVGVDTQADLDKVRALLAG